MYQIALFTPVGAATDSAGTMATPSTIVTAIILGSLLGLLLLIAVVILGACICACLHVYNSRRTQEDTDTDKPKRFNYTCMENAGDRDHYWGLLHETCRLKLVKLIQMLMS